MPSRHVAFPAMPKIVLLEGDITHETVDAIVNAANSWLAGGGGVDGAIHDAAGPMLDEECAAIRKRIGSLPEGGAVITSGGNLSARWVIHAVGPRYRDGKQGEPALLQSAYRECLARAKENGIATISFPSISTGIFGYPVEEAAPIALGTVWEGLGDLGPEAQARFVLFDATTFAAYQTAARTILPRGAWTVAHSREGE